MSRLILKRGNDQVVTLMGLRAVETQEYLNDAVVTATLFDSKGNVVTPFEDVPMVYVPDSNGDYEWMIDGPMMMLPKSVEYSLEVKAEQESLNHRVVHVVSVVDGDS